MHGFIDQIREEGEGLVIVDLKSDKSKPSKAELDMDLQFTIYAFAVHQIFRQPIKACVHYHLRTNEEILTYRDPERCIEIIGKVIRFATLEQTDDGWLIYEGRGGWLEEPIATIKNGRRMAATCAAIYLLLM